MRLSVQRSEGHGDAGVRHIYSKLQNFPGFSILKRTGEPFTVTKPAIHNVRIFSPIRVRRGKLTLRWRNDHLLWVFLQTSFPLWCFIHFCTLVFHTFISALCRNVTKYLQWWSIILKTAYSNIRNCNCIPGFCTDTNVADSWAGRMSSEAAASTPAVSSKGDYYWVRSFVAGGKIWLQFWHFESHHTIVAAYPQTSAATSPAKHFIS